ERRHDRDHEREDVDDRERDQEAVGQRAPDALTADCALGAPELRRRSGCAHLARPPTTDAARNAMRRRFRPGSRSRVSNRVMIVNTTMIGNRMNARAAPTPHSFELNEALNERNAGVRVVFSGLPFVPT